MRKVNWLVCSKNNFASYSAFRHSFEMGELGVELETLMERGSAGQVMVCCITLLDKGEKKKEN